MPAAVRANGTLRQFGRIGERRIRCEDTINHTASAIAPLATAAPNTSVRKAKSFFRRTPFMSEPDEEFVHSPPFLEKRHRAIGLDYAKQNGARAASGTGAERRRRTRRVFAGAGHVWLMNVLFQTRQRLAQIGGV